jgi:hypothetical protein
LKEAIRASQSFFLVDNDLKEPRIVVQLASVESSVEEGISSAIAIAIVYDSLQTPGNGIWVTVIALSCPSDQVQACAKNTLPHIDRGVETCERNGRPCGKLFELVPG